MFQLGVTDLFNEATADLSGISEDMGLYVSEVAQKAFINVTVTGVEAAAATAGAYLIQLRQNIKRCYEYINNKFV